MKTSVVILSLCFLWPLFTLAEEETPAYWEYGAGFGYIHYEHYPASEEYSDLFLPFPTFQFRGKILRADDRDGAHAYLLKSSDWTVELSGSGQPALDSSKNKARQGMDDLPWVIALGPQLIWKINPNFEASLAAFQAASTDFRLTKNAGGVFQSRLRYRWEAPFHYFETLQGAMLYGNLYFTLKGGSKEFFSIYYDVPSEKITATRPAFEARAGLLSYEITYFQSVKFGRTSFYFGGAYTNYGDSVNRKSPLHKTDENLSYLIGMTYVFGESQKREVPEEDTSGIINRIRDRNKPF